MSLIKVRFLRGNFTVNAITNTWYLHAKHYQMNQNARYTTNIRSAMDIQNHCIRQTILQNKERDIIRNKYSL